LFAWRSYIRVKNFATDLPHDDVEYFYRASDLSSSFFSRRGSEATSGTPGKQKCAFPIPPTASPSPGSPIVVSRQLEQERGARGGGGGRRGEGEGRLFKAKAEEEE
jgi:hypothetical protein